MLASIVILSPALHIRIAWRTLRPKPESQARQICVVEVCLGISMSPHPQVILKGSQGWKPLFSGQTGPYWSQIQDTIGSSPCPVKMSCLQVLPEHRVVLLWTCTRVRHCSPQCCFSQGPEIVKHFALGNFGVKHTADSQVQHNCKRVLIDLDLTSLLYQFSKN